MKQIGLQMLFALVLASSGPGILALPDEPSEAGRKGDVADESDEAGYREEQVAGLNKSASKIFYSERPWTWSLWGELNGVYDVSGEQDTSSGDIELFYENLARLTGYLSFRLAPNMVLTLESQLEYFRDKDGNDESENNPEVYFDFLGSDYINVRVGLSPVHIGYINNNDEPVLFYSVNRPATERLIIPTEWVEFGFHFYGNITPNLHYAFAILNGPEASEFTSATWIRGGKEGRFDLEHPNYNLQLEYTGFENLTLSFSGYFGETGQGEQVLLGGQLEEVKGDLTLLSGYARWDLQDVRIIAMGTYGWLDDTEEIFELTRRETGVGQVIGEQVYGFYVEGGYDLLGRWRRRQGYTAEHHGEKKFFNRSEFQMPIFARLERLDTHESVADSLQALSFFRNDLEVFMIGLNFFANEDFVFKLNYQMRDNLAAEGTDRSDVNLLEIGIGFAF